MRNLLALIFIAVFCSTASAQESKYIVYTSASANSTKGISRYQVSPNNTLLYDSEKENYPSYSFMIYSSSNNGNKDFYSHFICHDSKKDDPRPLHIYKKPLVWLDSIQYTDWDEVGEQMTKKEVEDFFTELHLQERIYMIDRRDFTTDSLTVIEARAYKPLLY